MSNRDFKTAKWWSFLLRYAILTILGGTLASGTQDQLQLKHHGGNFYADTRSPVNLDSSISWYDKIYYSRQSPIFGTEPWVSDGTDSGTKMIGDIAPLAKNSDPRNFTSSQDYLYFIANNDRGIPTLCRIDRNDQLKVVHEFNTHSRVLQTRTLGHKVFVSLKDENVIIKSKKLMIEK